MDRMDTTHQLTLVAVKLKSKQDMDEVSATHARPAPGRPITASRT